MKDTLFVISLLLATSAHSLVVDVPQPTVVIYHAVGEFGPQVLGDPTYPSSYPSVTASLVGLSADSNPIDGCSVEQLPTDPKDLPNVWFLLAVRGNCDFASKAELAQEAGAAGVIIYNDIADGKLLVMHEEDGNDVIIPSIFITNQAGQDLLQLLTPDDINSVILTINATGCAENCGPWDNQWQISVLWFLFIAFLAMWVVVLVCFSTALCRRWCHRTARQRAVGSLRRRKYKKVVAPSAAPSTVSEGDSKENEGGAAGDVEQQAAKAAAAAAHVDPDSRFNQDSCVICLCEFENGDQLMVLPCEHEYHTECINPWLLKKSSKCPICKASCMPMKPTTTTTTEESARTPLLLNGVNDETYDPEVGRDAEGEGEEEEEEEDPDSDDEDDDDDVSTDVWNTRILGLHPGALVLAGACCTGLGIAVAIMIFLFDS